MLRAIGYNEYAWFKDGNEMLDGNSQPIRNDTIYPTEIDDCTVQGIADCGKSRTSNVFLIRSCLHVYLDPHQRILLKVQVL